jgi:N-acetyl sugar amidotransferase
MKYCLKCLLPNTKPDLLFNDIGVCNACTNYDNRKYIDYDSRKIELINLLEKYKSKDGSNWDCIIPVSGGKDSTYQVHTIQKLGFNPLCVVATTCHLSEIGRKNIENIKDMGVDIIEFTNNRIMRQKLNKYCLTEIGDISWPEHVSIFTIPVRVAVNYKIPLIIWGECSQNEYGGPASVCDNNVLDRKWLEEFGGLIGLRVSDIIELANIDKNSIISLQYPSDEDIQKVGVTGIFLGYYVNWCGLNNAIISQSNGFTTYTKNVEGSICNYENLDNYQTVIHDYFKYLKFGFDRCNDIASSLIRRKIISREDAIDIVIKNSGKFPSRSLGKSIDDILSYIDMTIDEFVSICDKFTNKALFKVDKDNTLVKDASNNLVPLFIPTV